MTITADYAALCAEVKAEFPKFKIAKKSGNWFLRLVGHVMGQQFMTNYITTIVNTVYVPDDWDTWADDSKSVIIRHERVHMRQSRKLTYPFYAFLYLLVMPMFLSYFRAKLEMEAYTESLKAFKDYGMDYNSPYRKQWLVNQYVTGAYGWMWPFPKTVGRWFDEAVSKLDS